MKRCHLFLLNPSEDAHSIRDETRLPARRTSSLAGRAERTLDRKFIRQAGSHRVFVPIQKILLLRVLVNSIKE